jgi:type II secretory pathway component GspD/PulD (secretin)
MIGGLLRKKNTKTISRVPLLGSIPFLGRLFRYDTSDNQNRELIIFITPYILNNKGDSLDGKKKSIDFSSRESSMSKREKSIEDDLMNINNRYQTK